jgi:Family of unknown function (DUF6496)
VAQSAPQSNNKAVVFRGRPEREMQLQRGTSPKTISKNISEFHGGETFAHTAEKFGKERANKQAVAVALIAARKSGKHIPKRTRRAAHSAMRRGLISEKAAKAHLGE